jgi:hypothetical protein
MAEVEHELLKLLIEDVHAIKLTVAQILEAVQQALDRQARDRDAARTRGSSGPR